MLSTLSLKDIARKYPYGVISVSESQILIESKHDIDSFYCIVCNEKISRDKGKCNPSKTHQHLIMLVLYIGGISCQS